MSEAPEIIYLIAGDDEHDLVWCEDPDPTGSGYADEAVKYLRDDTALDLAVKEAQRERDLLAQAIRDAAVKTGGCRPDVDLTGPQLLMLIDDMAEALLERQAASNS